MAGIRMAVCCSWINILFITDHEKDLAVQKSYVKPSPNVVRKTEYIRYITWLNIYYTGEDYVLLSELLYKRTGRRSLPCRSA